MAQSGIRGTRLLQRLRPHNVLRYKHFNSKRTRYNTAKTKNKENDARDNFIMVNGEILYGYYPVLMAIKAGKRKFHALYYNDEGKDKIQHLAEMAIERGIPTKATAFASISFLASRIDKTRGVHQGVCADVDRLPLASPQHKETTGSPPLWLLLCGVRDPMNLGSILRTAYYLGVENVITTLQFPSSSPTPVVSKATSGVMEIFPPCIVPNALDFLIDQHGKGWQIIGSDSAGSRQQQQQPSLDRPTILVLGSEGSGIPDELRNCCSSGFLTLDPGRKLNPDVDSLNVSVAAALLIQKLKNTTVTVT